MGEMGGHTKEDLKWNKSAKQEKRGGKLEASEVRIHYFIQKESDGHYVARPFLGCTVTGSRVKDEEWIAVGHLLVGGHLDGPIFKYNRYMGTRYRLTSDIAKTKRYLRLSIISVSCISMSQA